MTLPLANVNPATSTFANWLQRTNRMSYIFSTEAMTANSTLGETNGNAYLQGTFSSNTLVATQGLRGGNNSTSNVLTISSNTNLNGHLAISNTLNVAGNTSLTGVNASFIAVTSGINVSNTLTINSSSISLGESEITGNMISVGNVEVNSTTIMVGATIINSTTIGESSNNSNYLDAHSWESPKEIGAVGPNTANFTTVSINKISANGALGTTGDILKANSSGGLFWSTGGEGYTGSIGPRGFTGSAGANGTSGSDGPRGFTGSAGNTGSQGPIGYTGSRGNNGVPGDQGYTGSKGDPGGIGARGYTGSVGNNGSQGPIGYTGSSGTALNGYTGSIGFTGSRGNTGSAGARGFTGSAGSQGPRGYTGSAAAAGGSAQFTSVGVGTAPGVTGEIRATNNITAYYSDERLKTKIKNIPNALNKVMSLNGFYFTPNETAQELGYSSKRDIGVSAQEVKAILPEIVVPAPVDSQYLTVYYEKLIPLLIEAIKELKTEVDEFRAVR